MAHLVVVRRVAVHLVVVVVEGVVVAAVADIRDRVGLGWRSEIAPHIMTHLEQLDVLEVIAENYFSASKKSIQSLHFLSKQLPIVLHGVAMGLASSQDASVKHIEKMARLVERIQPESWSEHLAFVRAGAIEIGHLAAPPRNEQTIDGTLKNILMAKKIVGSFPHLENIATLVEPTASCFSEGDWVNRIICESNAPLLLDLHNLYANAKNAGLSAESCLKQLPLKRVTTVHLSGGCWMKTPDGNSQRLIDDHIHDVPTQVFELLVLVAQHAQHPLTVLIERDGNFPHFSHLIAQVDMARQALRKGRLVALKGVTRELA
jgi:uncharacterized protein